MNWALRGRPEAEDRNSLEVRGELTVGGKHLAISKRAIRHFVFVEEPDYFIHVFRRTSRGAASIAMRALAPANLTDWSERLPIRKEDKYKRIGRCCHQRPRPVVKLSHR